MKYILVLLLAICSIEVTAQEDTANKELFKVYNVYRRHATDVMEYATSFSKFKPRFLLTKDDQGIGYKVNKDKELVVQPKEFGITKIDETNKTVTTSVIFRVPVRGNCLGIVILHGDIFFEGKENRSRISVINLRYSNYSTSTGELAPIERKKGNLPAEGSYYDLLAADICNGNVNEVDNFLHKAANNLFKEYHRFLAETTRQDDKW